jgi:PAS domain S-box-containing protein
MPDSVALMSAADVASFIHEYYDAWGGVDEDRIMSYYADNVVLQIPGALLEGKEAVRDQFVRPFVTAFPGNRHLVKNIICGPGVASVEFSFEAQHKGSFKGHAASGARVKLPGCGFYEYDAVKRQITAGRIYYDIGTLLHTITEVPENRRTEAAQAVQLNQRNLSLIINTIPTAAWTTSRDGYCDFLNQRWLDYTGMTAEQAAGWGWAEAIHPDDRKGLVEYWQSALASGVPCEAEARMRRSDSSYRWFLFRATPLRDDSGTITKWYGTNIDIEDRKRAEDALRARELSWRQIVDNIPGLVATMGAMGEVEFLNRQTLEYFGKTSRELKDWAFIDVVHPDDLPRVIEARRKSIEAEAIYEVEHRCRRADGVYRWFQVRGLPVRSEEGTVEAWYLLLTDIDDLKKAESKLRQVIDTIPALAWCNLPDGPNEFLNRGWHEYTGLSPEESHGWGWQVAFHPDDLPPLMDKWVTMLTTGESGEIEARLRRHDGVYRWFLIRAEPFRDESGKLVRWYGTSTDIDDRKRAEAEVERAYLRLAEAQRLSKTGSFITDLLADEHNWSEELYRIFEFDPGTRITHEAIRTVFHPEDLPIYEAAFKHAVGGLDRDLELTYRIITPAGNVKHVHAVTHVVETVAGRPVFIGAIQDVTASKVAEEALSSARAELAHMARVTTLSALTASIGHEVTQPIAAVITSADACLRWLNRDQPDLSRAREAVMRIQDDGKRAAVIISHLKSFHRKDVSPQRERVSTNDIVRDMPVFLRSEANRHSVVMRTELAADLPLVRGDRVQLQQVLMNLMLNGMEAMSGRGGELTIRTQAEEGAVLVSVSDVGAGVPPDMTDHIFNAFYTTKAGGTGMGLAISRTIIEAHGGRLWATSNPERGATFHFTLPTGAET